MRGAAIEVTGLGKSFGKVAALDGVDLTVPQGTVLGLLGHNGAGKSTLIGVLATLLRPSRGTARVAGHDVVDEPSRVRRSIGVAGQTTTLDPAMSGRDNLLVIARLCGAGRRDARARADRLLELFGLTAAAGRPARTYSGGMRRRLDLAVTLVRRPEVVFLDEPGTGLDPVSRLDMWDMVRGLTGLGSTVVLTTQHLDEADRLADSITVLSGGRVIADGTPEELKARIGRRTATAWFAADQDAVTACRALDHAGLRPVLDRPQRSVAAALTRDRDLADLVRALDAAAVEPARLTLAEPGLDQVYLALTSDTPERSFR
ncbi:daunorubicin/doxorubicin resistance ABC transporter ATP-binding protein DrrA [Actinomadura sp. CNU-125]|uniref:ABC transporter ATP-binding protein n=1 Tax=Actinomadura sp. CNU-125 TaxID=1904961 RepID=UPI00095978B5|nr:ATP-binding cassette domain-containing protein [Actinomadura sp. CNU-125]OLT16569.1 daunorubicin/doxorubicin resistance ABC transporter ATP-binding protein DrrA [Actinomadura sp. CNU-125]